MYTFITRLKSSNKVEHNLLITFLDEMYTIPMCIYDVTRRCNSLNVTLIPFCFILFL